MPLPKRFNKKKVLTRPVPGYIETQIRARISVDHLHQNSRLFLKRILDHVDYMRAQGKSESEIAQHLHETHTKYEALREILEKRQEPTNR